MHPRSSSSASSSGGGRQRIRLSSVAAADAELVADPDWPAGSARSRRAGESGAASKRARSGARSCSSRRSSGAECDEEEEHFDASDAGEAGAAAGSAASSSNSLDSSPTESGGRRRSSDRSRLPSRQLPEEAVALLRAWIDAHSDHPFPNDDEKDMLVLQTGLTFEQLQDWFINARRRYVKRKRGK